MNKVGRAVGYGFVGIFILFFDRITKIMAIMWCQERCEINQFISFDLAFNRGISWGFFHSNTVIIFFVVSFIISGITCAIAIYGLKRFLLGYKVIGELFVVVGSISNLIDRFYYKGVIDFIELSYQGYSWPIFNIADICIVAGIVFIVVENYIL